MRRTSRAPSLLAGALTILALAVSLLPGAAQQAEQEPAQEPMPRFRAGTNLVRLDAYVTADGQPVTDLAAEDFEVFEDDQPQKVENFELIRAHDGNGVTTAAPNPSSTRDQREAAQDPDARLFVIFLDNWHVGLDGSARSSDAVAGFLDKVVGPRDLVGVMTPDITPQNMTLTRRGEGIDRILRDAWTWGQRDRLNTLDPHEQDIRTCYPDSGSTAGIAQEMIERRREQKTLRALDSMVRHLDGLREERKFVVLLSEGWILFRRNDQLARPLGGSTPGGAPPVGVGIDGRVTTQPDPREGGYGAGSLDSCERERVMLSTSITSWRFASSRNAPTAPTCRSIPWILAAWWCSTTRSAGHFVPPRRSSTGSVSPTGRTGCGNWPSRPTVRGCWAPTTPTARSSACWRIRAPTTCSATTRRTRSSTGASAESL